MWRNLAGRASSTKVKFYSESPSCLPSNCSTLCKIPSFKGSVRGTQNAKPRIDLINVFFTQNGNLGIIPFAHYDSGFSRVFNHVRCYGNAAEAIISTDAEEEFSGSDGIQEVLDEINKQEKRSSQLPKKTVAGMVMWKYHLLRRRQIKMKTEACEGAAKEYQELLEDMCEQKLAPNLPYLKSLILSWFEPLRDAIAAEKEFLKEKGNNRASHGPYFDQLGADMMAVITMHKLMGLLTTNTGENGSTRVIQAACAIGEAIEHEVMIHKFLTKTKKNTSPTDFKCEGESDLASSEKEKQAKEQERLRKKVNQLSEKQKLHQVNKIVRGKDDYKPWDQEAHVKIGCRLIHLLMEMAYIRPPGGDFFESLREYGFRHSRDWCLVVSHVLARNGRFNELSSVIHQMLADEGSGSAPALCELLESSFSDCDSNNLVWDALAFLYSRSEMVHDALFVLAKMKDLNMRASTQTYNSLLYNLRHTEIVWDVYNDLIASGTLPSEVTHAILIDALCKQSRLHDAIPFLRGTKGVETGPSVVSFNTVMSRFCKLGFVEVAKSFFCMMLKTGLLPDSYSYNILIHGLCVAGSMEEALEFTNDMDKHGVNPDTVTYNILAKGFHVLGSIDGAGTIIQKMLLEGMNTDILTYTILICGHCQMGNVEEGLKVREEMLSRGLKLTLISYSVLLSGLCKCGQVEEALKLLPEMENIGLQPDLITYSILIHFLCKQGEVRRAIQIYSKMCSGGILPNSFAFRSILLGLCEKGRIPEARVYFDTLTASNSADDIMLYNIMIDGYVKHGNTGEAVQLYRQIIEKGVTPSIVTLNSLIHGFCKNKKLAEARRLFDTVERQGLVPNAITYTTLMNAFCEEGYMHDMFELFRKMEAKAIEPTHITYTVLLKGLCKQRKLQESVQLIDYMCSKGITPDQITYNTIIQCFCKARDMSSAFQLHSEMLQYNLEPTPATYNVLINGLCVYGDVNDADKLMISLQGANFSLGKVSYTTMIKAHCVKGDVHRAIVFFRQMVEKGYDISIRDYSAAINRLCKRGTINEAKVFFSMMLCDGIAPDQEICEMMLNAFHQDGDHSSVFEVLALMIKSSLCPD